MAQLHLSYNTVIISTTPEAAHCTATHASIAAHMYMQQWKTHSADIRGWQNIWHTHIHRLSCLSNQVGAAFYSIWQVKKNACLQAMKKTNSWPMLTDCQHRLNQANRFLCDKGAWHTTSSADLKNTKQTASKQLELVDSQQNGPHSECILQRIWGWLVKCNKNTMEKMATNWVHT